MTPDGTTPTTEPAPEPLSLPSRYRGTLSPRDVREYGINVVSTLRGKDGLRIDALNSNLRKMRGNALLTYNRWGARRARWEKYAADLPFPSDEYERVESKIKEIDVFLLKLAVDSDKLSEKVTSTAMAAGLDVGLPSTAPRVDVEVSDAREDDEARE